MEPMSAGTLAAVIAVISGSVTLANQLFRPGEKPMKGFGPIDLGTVPVGTRYVFSIDSVDDEARATINEKPFLIAGSNEKKEKAFTVRPGDNKIYLVVRNSGSGRWSVRVNIKAESGAPGWRMQKPYGGQENFFPGEKISNFIFVWHIKGQ